MDLGGVGLAGVGEGGIVEGEASISGTRYSSALGGK